MRVVVVAVGRLKDGPERALVERYRERCATLGRRIALTGCDLSEVAESHARRAGDRMAEEAGAVFIRIDRLDGTSGLFGPAPQSAFNARGGIGDMGSADRAVTPCLKERPAPDAAVEAYRAREIKFDPDVWVVEVEDREGRNFLDVVAG